VNVAQAQGIAVLDQQEKGLAGSEPAGGGLEGGAVDAHGDHRIAMAAAVSALGARGPVSIEGIESAEVSFPGFIDALAGLGARIEVSA